MPRKAKPTPLPPIDVLRERFTYDPDTGIIRWRSTLGTAVVGAEAGCSTGTGEGYRGIGLSRGSPILQAHRVAWALYHGADPGEALVNHVNGDCLDNRITNLRLATRSQSTMSGRLRKNNTSGYPGVDWCARKNKWRARIRVDGRYIFLGWHDRFEDAVAARKRGEAKYFGEFVPQVAA